MPNRFTNKFWSTKKRSQNERGEWECNTCYRWLPEKAFGVSKRLWNGITPDCKKCRNKKHKASRHKAGGKPRAFYEAERHVPIGVCSSCRQEKELSEFYKIKSKRGYSHACKVCMREQNRKRSQLPEAKLKRCISQKKYRKRKQNDAEWRRQQAARDMVSAAVQGGFLTRQHCEVCGEKKSYGHHDDYDKPLEVRWLCGLHHAEAHKNN